MYYILYSSYATKDFTDTELKDLLLQSQAKNARLGVTGMLFYFSGKFIQLIEGDEVTVKSLAKTIAQDSRHEYFMILKEGPIEKRFFEDWSMGFKSIDPEHFKDVANFKELNNSAGLGLSPFLYLLNILSDHQ